MWPAVEQRGEPMRLMRMKAIAVGLLLIALCGCASSNRGTVDSGYQKTGAVSSTFSVLLSEPIDQTAAEMPEQIESSDADLPDRFEKEKDELEYDLFVADNILYYSTYSIVQGAYPELEKVYSYDPKTGTSQKLGDFSASFVRTQAGNYCISSVNNDLYQLTLEGLEKLGTIPKIQEQECTFFAGVLDNTVYFAKTTHGDYASVFYAMELSSGEVREIYRDTERELKNLYLRDGKIYYQTTYETADPQLHVLDLGSGTSQVMEVQFPGTPSRYDMCLYYDDCIIVYAALEAERTDEWGLYRLDYETGEAKPLGSQLLAQNAYRQDDTLYFETFYSPSVQGDNEKDPYGKITVMELWDSAPQEIGPEIYAELLYACPTGCYYDDVRADMPGLYFYDLSKDCAVRIDKEASPAQE